MLLWANGIQTIQSGPFSSQEVKNGQIAQSLFDLMENDAFR